MRILNAMFGKGLGGIEQAFLDYSNGLTYAGCHVISVVHKYAAIRDHIKGDYYPISNFSKYDFFTIIKLKRILRKEQPDCIITHGNRAARLLRCAAKNIPVVSLCHNYSFKQLLQSHAIITVAEDLRRKVKASGYSRVFTIPNMIDIGDKSFIHPTFHTPVVIGTMGRFVKKKGFDVFLKALSILNAKGIAFRAIIGGEGEEQDNLTNLVQKLSLENQVKFLGWVKDKEEFYQNIDIFCLPSLHEPFGIVILEAFKYSKPIITTSTEGPSNIIEDQVNGLFVEIQDASDLADKIELLINNPSLAVKLAKNGFETGKQKYESKAVISQLINLLSSIIKNIG